MQVLILLDLNRMILFHIPRLSVTLTELDSVQQKCRKFQPSTF